MTLRFILAPQKQHLFDREYQRIEYSAEPLARVESANPE